MRVVIADDEPLARQRIEDLLAKEEDVDVVAGVANGQEALQAVRAHRPDLLFLDVQMPGMSGLEVASSLAGDQGPLIVFVTAYDQFAPKAFDVAAVDYLVKPFDDERFAEALRRARKALPPSRKYADRLKVELRGQVRLVPVELIDHITASGPYAELHVGERTFAMRERMQTLERRLDPNVFFRIHRSAIVRLDRVEALLHRAGGHYGVRLKNGTELSVSRARRDELAQRLGM